MLALRRGARTARAWAGLLLLLQLVGVLPCLSVLPQVVLLALTRGVREACAAGLALALRVPLL
jgi:hypothetical protein